MSMHNRSDDDPLSRFRDGVVRKGSGLPIPLTATRFHVTLQGHVAAVETWRTFRNGESESIEATLTMPMPVRAVLYDLEATVAGRTLKGICQPREAARQTYEYAIDGGRFAVLHEEVLRGIHQLSLAHLSPGAEVVIRARWAALLVPNEPRRAMLRIPLTVGDVYGRSPLRASDRLSSGGPNGMARLSISAGDKTVWLGETPLQAGEIEVPLNRPIDLSMEAPSRSTSAGRAADGRSIALSIVAEPESDHAIAAAILVDRSGSMAERCSADAATTKHGAVVAGLRSVSCLLRSADQIDLFEFNQACQALGKATTAGGFEELLWHLGGPQGGTEIGGALQEAIDRSPAKNVLIVTDGKSYALDAMALARTGRRFSVVLIGEDSLEAGIGHLAALTRGLPRRGARQRRRRRGRQRHRGLAYTARRGRDDRGSARSIDWRSRWAANHGRMAAASRNRPAGSGGSGGAGHHPRLAPVAGSTGHGPERGGGAGRPTDKPCPGRS